MATAAPLVVLMLILSGTNCIQWTEDLPDGQHVYACTGSDVSLPWTFNPAQGDSIISTEWFYNGSQKVIAIFSHGNFVPVTAFSERLEHTTNGGLVLRHVTASDSGNYTVEVYGGAASGASFTLRRTVQLQVSDHLMTSDGLHRMTQSPYAVYDDVTDQWSLQLRCGHFLYQDQPPFPLEWVMPSGRHFNSTGYHDNHFYFLVPNPAESGRYTCRVPDNWTSQACLSAGHPREAYLTLDSVDVRLMLMEAELRSLRQENQRLTQNVTDLQLKNQRLTQNIAFEQERLAQNVSGLQQKNERFLQIVTKIQQESQCLTQNLKRDSQSLTQNVTDLRQEALRLIQNVTNLRQEDLRFIMNVTGLQLEDLRLAQNVTELQHKNLRLTQNMTDIQQKNQHLTESVTDLQEKNQRLTQNATNLQQEILSLTQYVTVMEHEDQRLTRDVTDLQHENQHLDVDTQHLLRRVSTLETELHAIVSNQVSFHTTTSALNLYLRRGEIMILSTVLSNHGNAYDKTTGVFTVPYEGTYLFIASTGSNSPTLDAYMYLMADGSRVGVAFAHKEILENNEMATCHAVLQLRRGQRVWLQSVGEANFNAGDTYFSGFLISNTPL